MEDEFVILDQNTDQCNIFSVQNKESQQTNIMKVMKIEKEDISLSIQQVKEVAIMQNLDHSNILPIISH